MYILSSNCLICLFSYNRYGHLKLCLDFLLRDIDKTSCEIIVFDDGSEDDRISKYLERVFIENARVKQFCMKPKRGGPTSTTEGANRIAAQRKVAIDVFLATDYDYVFLLDDDVVVSCTTIMEAVKDFDFLSSTDYLNPGAISLHGQLGTDGYVAVDGKVFSLMHLTGEAHLLLSRTSLIAVGNKFGIGRRGFADTQLEALLNAGYDYIERTHPCYQVQHFGFGDKGSVIHEHQSKVPIWNRGPYRSTWKHGKNRPLEVSGFDLGKYCACVQEHGGRNAPLAYLGEYDG